GIGPVEKALAEVNDLAEEVIGAGAIEPVVINAVVDGGGGGAVEPARAQDPDASDAEAVDPLVTLDGSAFDVKSVGADNACARSNGKARQNCAVGVPDGNDDARINNQTVAV